MVSINKYLNENDVKISKIRDIFEIIVSSCWVLGNEKRNKIWVSALIQRLRQVQLLTQITTIEQWSYSIKKYNDININNFVKDIYNFNNINGNILSPFQLQNLNMYLPHKETNIKQIPYYTTLPDKYKNKFKQDDDKIEQKHPNGCKLYDVLNNITNNIQKSFKSRTPKHVQTTIVKKPLVPNQPNQPNIFSDMRYSNFKTEVTFNELPKNTIHTRNMDSLKYSRENNKIPVKIKYIKDSKDDNKSKYVIEIPKKELKGKNNKDHIKAVLWGSSNKGLEIKLPVETSNII